MIIADACIGQYPVTVINCSLDFSSKSMIYVDGMENARRAIKDLNQTFYMGRRLLVDIDKKHPEYEENKAIYTRIESKYPGSETASFCSEGSYAGYGPPHYGGGYAPQQYQGGYAPEYQGGYAPPSHRGGYGPPHNQGRPRRGGGYGPTGKQPPGNGDPYMGYTYKGLENYRENYREMCMYMYF